jgi:uncharacterized membrane protein YraQ (UPF0718 family)/copper chaperone CopZ
MAPYLLLGFLIAGILYVYFPKERVSKYLGKSNFGSVLNATLIGIPLPLCSCGVIPTGISFFKNGASRGSSVSFLISTPQTGVDSILATYSLLGLPMAIIRPVIALITGLLGGLVTNSTIKGENLTAENETANVNSNPSIPDSNRFVRMMHYAFVEFLQDISKWLIIGLLIAALMAVLIPDNFFIDYINNEYLSMLVVLIAAIPLYVCATGSVPIAAVLLIKGLSPGAAIVFLMAGPATNAATMTVIGNVMGKKTLYAYMTSIITGAIIFGIIVNEWLPRQWFTDFIAMDHHGEHVHFIPEWLKITSGVLLVLLVINGYWQKYKVGRKNRDTIIDSDIQSNIEMNEKVVKVDGMTCNHCKMNVENNLKALEGIENIEVDLASSKVLIKGEDIDLNQIKETVEGIGYEYKGEAD